MSEYRIILADDHALFRQGMKKIIPLLFGLTFFLALPIQAQEKSTVLETITKEIEKRLKPTKKTPKQTPTKKTTPAKKKGKTITKAPSKNSNKDYPWMEIPVVFHVINSCESNKITYRKKLKNLLQLVNFGMNNPNKESILKPYDEIVCAPNIRLKLAGDILRCFTNKDVSYHISPKSSFQTKNADLKFQLEYDRELKKHGYINSKGVLNIWICDLDGNDGYASFPKEQNPFNDGIVINKRRFEDDTTPDQLRLLITHELGHYLGLQHLWGMNIMISGCLLRNDDGIVDTPQQKGKNQYNYFGDKTHLMHKICRNKNQTSNFQNFMDYANNTGMFTQDQVALMRNQIKAHRSKLLFNLNCNIIPKNTGNCPTSGSNNTNTGYSGPTADVCMSNYRSYKRRVVLTHRKTGLKKTVLMARGSSRYPKKSCLYEIPSGVYNCKVYTTFSNTVIEDFEVKLQGNQSNEIKLTAHGN